MKLTKRTGDESSIRKVWSDDKQVCYGLVGTVGDFCDKGIFEHCDFERIAWAFVPAPRSTKEVQFGATRAVALENIE